MIIPVAVGTSSKSNEFVSQICFNSKVGYLYFGHYISILDIIEVIQHYRKNNVTVLFTLPKYLINFTNSKKIINPLTVRIFTVFGH